MSCFVRAALLVPFVDLEQARFPGKIIRVYVTRLLRMVKPAMDENPELVPCFKARVWNDVALEIQVSLE